MNPGEKIGPYEITGFLGAGAMGEVHRARDPRLGREVAIKTLPESLGLEPERVRRFDLEVRSAGTLNHPNVLTIYDTGASGGIPYLVSELLEGHTLRTRLADGPLPLRRAIDLAAQAARGLAAAHARGIVHRDLKPDNLFVGDDGTLKILDFGLAKLTEKGEGVTPADDSVAGTLTGTGYFMGTMGYIAPEQARGLPATPASDLFALGCVLYEMVTGVRAFRKETPVDTMMAILNEDPAPLPAKVRAEAPGLDAVLRRCLEKQPGERFESARDLAFALGLIAAESLVPAADGTAGAGTPGEARVESRVTFHRVTFRRGTIERARFTPDGHAVIYGGAWEGHPVETFWMPLGNPEGRPLGHPGADVFAVARTGEMALCLKRRTRGGFQSGGTLARAPMGGGAARQLMQNVDEADWNPEGTQLAVARHVEGRMRLEYPIGRVLFETAGWISHLRVSLDGKRVAFLHHPYQMNDLGDVIVIEPDGAPRTLSDDWGTIRGLAWSADGSEVWFTANRGNAGRALHAVDLSGRLRMLHQVPGQLTIQDVLPDGRVLMTHSTERQAVMVRTALDSAERDLSWLDWSILRDISPDGQWLLIVEGGEGGGADGAICIRPTDGSAAILIADGNATQFSPDGAWILAINRFAMNRILLFPTGIGEPREIDAGDLSCQLAKWFPDGKSVLVLGSEPGGPLALFRVDVESGARTPFGPRELMTSQFEVSPDGRHVIARSGKGAVMLYPVDGGDPVPVQGLHPDDAIQAWKLEGEAILVLPEGQVPARIHRVELATGARTLWKEVSPPDPTGVLSQARFMFQPDGQTYGYTYRLQLDDLYVVENLR